MSPRFEAAYTELVAAWDGYHAAPNVGHRLAARSRLHAARSRMAAIRAGEAAAATR